MKNSWNLPLHRVSDGQKNLLSIWDSSHVCYEQNLFGQVTCLTYSNNGNFLGCTSSNQITLLRVPHSGGVAVNTQTEKKNFSLHFRDDDKLFLQTVEQRVVVKSTETLFERQFTGHTRDVRSAIFLGRQNFASASDDTTVKLWDLLSSTELETGRTHTDYVRSLENYTSGCFFSGSYDHTINLWDPRIGLSTAPVSHTTDSLDAGVECMCFTPKNNLLFCGVGDKLVVFDMRKGLSSSLLQSSLHTKSVVSVTYSEKFNTVISASLDGRVKMLVMEGEEMHCVSTKKFDDPVCSVAVHPDSTEFAVGCTSGAVKVFKLKEEAASEEEQALVEAGLVKRKLTKDELTRHKMKVIQQNLASFQYGKAIKSALYARHQDVLMSTIEELLRRGALHVALNNQNDRTIVQLLRFATHHVDKPQFVNTMMAVFEVIFLIYGSAAASNLYLHRELVMAQKKIADSIAVLRQMERSMGIMELLLNN